MQTGEEVFKELLGKEWASPKRPIIHRATEWSTKIKINFLYAKNSWLQREQESDLRKLLPNHKLDYKILDQAGHHLYSDNAEDFNSYINNLENENNNSL